MRNRKSRKKKAEVQEYGQEEIKRWKIQTKAKRDIEVFSHIDPEKLIINLHVILIKTFFYLQTRNNVTQVLLILPPNYT